VVADRHHSNAQRSDKNGRRFLNLTRGGGPQVVKKARTKKESFQLEGRVISDGAQDKAPKSFRQERKDSFF